RLHPDLCGGGRRTRSRGEGQEGLHDRRQDLQGPSRRLQSDACPQRRSREIAAPGFLYWSDDGDLLAMRVHHWKIVFEEQRHSGFAVWREPFSKRRWPKLFNLRADPFERGDESVLYDKWAADRTFALVPAQVLLGQWVETFKEFPPRAKSASFSIDQVVEKFMPKS